MRSVFGAIGAAATGLRIVCGAAPIAVGVVGLVVGALVLPAQAADFKSVAPYGVVVTGEGAALRCADLSNSYAVRLLKPGDVLRVDGERAGWFRVEYLPGTRAWVHAKDAKFDADGKTLRLTQASTLMALNASGVRPWWPLLEKDLLAGTTFPDAQPITAADGSIEGYSVVAPPQARGYIRAEQVKKATPEQAAAAAAPAASTPMPVPAPTRSQPTPAPAIAQAPAPALTKPAPTPTTTEASKANPLPAVNPPAAQPVTIEKSFETVKADEPKRVVPPPAPIDTATIPATTTAAAPKAPTVAPAPAPVRVAAASTPPAPSPEVTKRIQDIELLRSMFDRVMKTGSEETEISTVQHEFERTIAGLGTSAEDQHLKTELGKRLDAIKLKQQVMDSRRATQTAGTSMEQRTISIHVAMQEVERQAVYTIVGTMIPSTVYDGKRGMPLMWRIESPDITSTRTVGYVVPRQGLDLISKTGRVVGIVGDSKLDPALGLNIVLPTRVDVLRFVEGRYQVESSQSVGEGDSTAPREPAPDTDGNVRVGDPQ